MSQLTPAKLEQLAGRHAGVEWVKGQLKQLDFAEAERADVLRGLKTYIAQGPEHAAHFKMLYQKLPKEKQLLPEGF